MRIWILVWNRNNELQVFSLLAGGGASPWRRGFSLQPISRDACGMDCSIWFSMKHSEAENLFPNRLCQRLHLRLKNERKKVAAEVVSEAKRGHSRPN